MTKQNMSVYLYINVSIEQKRIEEWYNHYIDENQ